MLPRLESTPHSFRSATLPFLTVGLWRSIPPRGDSMDEKTHGAEPLLIPEGAGAEWYVSRETTTLLSASLAVDADLQTIDENAIKVALAERYGVPMVYLGLGLHAGSVVADFAVTLGSGQSAMLSHLLEASADEHAFSRGLAAAIGANVSVVKSATVSHGARNVTKMRTRRCPAGHWCTAGVKVECEIGFYNPELNANNQSACQECPPHSSTAQAAATSIAACLCERGFFHDGSRCTPCVLGTNCTVPGLNLLMLPLEVGYWRYNRSSVDVRKCPDANRKTTGCVGGNEAICKANLTGPYCMLCEDALLGSATPHYYDSTLSACLDCSALGGSIVTFTILTSTVIGLGVALAAVVFYVRRRRREQQRQLEAPDQQDPSRRNQNVARIRRLLRNKRWKQLLSLRSYLRIVYSTYQVLVKVPTIYKLSLPSSVADLLSTLDKLIDIGLEPIIKLPLQCIGLHGFLPQLRTYMLMPILICTLILLFTACRIWLRSNHGTQTDNAKGRTGSERKAGNRELAVKVLESAFPSILFVTFLTFPVVSTQAFRAFVCEEIAGRSFLVADYRIECSSAGAASITFWAWLAILVYSVGIPALYAVVLLKERDVLLNNFRTKGSNALAFLHRPFRPAFFWWELVNVAQKLILVGFFVLQPFRPGSLLQLVLGTTVALLFAIMQMQFQPYRLPLHNLIATVMSLSQLTFFLSAILYRFYSLTDGFEAVAEQLESRWASERFKIDPRFLSTFMVLSIFGGLSMMFVLFAFDIALHKRDDVVRWSHNDEIVRPSALEPSQFHTFLSHNWASGQDQARTIKAQLTLTVPGLNVWLDVDNMRSKAGTKATDKDSFNRLLSNVLTVISVLTGSHEKNGAERSDYFSSKPCRGELHFAIKTRTPIVFVLETDPTHGGVSLEVHKREAKKWQDVRALRCLNIASVHTSSARSAPLC